MRRHLIVFNANKSDYCLSMPIKQQMAVVEKRIICAKVKGCACELCECIDRDVKRIDFSKNDFYPSKSQFVSFYIIIYLFHHFITAICCIIIRMIIILLFSDTDLNQYRVGCPFLPPLYLFLYSKQTFTLK